MQRQTLFLRVLGMTLVLLGAYAAVLPLLGRPSGAAETNLAAGLARLQALSGARGEVAVLSGTSIAANTARGSTGAKLRFCGTPP